MRQCSLCGAAVDAVARVCARCGAPLADHTAAPALESGQPRDIVVTTAHFSVVAPVGSFAALHAAEVGDRLEAVAATLAALLDLPAEPFGSHRVLLAESIPDPDAPNGIALAGTRFAPERGAIQSAYRPDAPGIELERTTVRAVVLRVTGTDLVGFPVLLTGLDELCRQRCQRAFDVLDVDRELATDRVLRRTSLVDLWHGPSDTTADSFPRAALSATNFLLEQGGSDRLRRFITFLASTETADAARAAFGVTWLDLSKRWHDTVRRAGGGRGGAVGRFIGRSVVYLRPHWKETGVIALCLTVQLAYQQLLPRAEALLIDRAILQHDLGFLARLVSGVVVLALLSLGASLLENLLTTRVTESVLRELRERMFAQLQRLSPRFYSATTTGDLLARFSGDLSTVNQGLFAVFSQGLTFVPSLVLTLVHIVLLDWLLAVIVVGIVPIFVLVTRWLGPRVEQASHRYAGERAATTTLLQENLSAQPVVKAFNLEATVKERFTLQARAFYDASVRLYVFSHLYGQAAVALTLVVEVIVLALGGYLVVTGGLAVGRLVEFLALVGLITAPVFNATGIIQAAQTATASLDRVEAVLSARPEVGDAPDAGELGPVEQGIRFEDVTFSYGGNTPQLRGVSLEIPAGQHVAIVGPSGSGKSTIINLLLRLYDPDQGRVLLDGQNSARVTLTSLRRQIGVVFQESLLFNATVRDNIRLGRIDATDEEVQEAAKLAEVHDAVAQLPHGYDTVVGERGGSLSGGQRQRLAIARAILRRPSLFLLDEATSALDSRTEAAISRTLAVLTKGRTTINVTHRLFSAQHADRIFVMDHGQLVQQGTHSELLGQEGLYRQLFEEQGTLSGGATAAPETARAAGESAAYEALQLAYLRGVPLFSLVPVDVVQRVAMLLQPEAAGAGDEIIRAGTPGDRLFLIVSGEADVLPPGPTVRPRLLATLGPGDYFGEVALLRDVPRTATVRARKAVFLLSLSRAAFEELLRDAPSVRTQLEAAMATYDGTR